MWYQCTASNTYDKTPCLLNETCNATKGCVSKCGEGFKPSCEGNKRVYCSNEGAICGRKDVGGIAGHLGSKSAATIENCYNAGAITGTSYAGGIAGYVQAAAQLKAQIEQQ